jgi:hypothetical protein
MKLLLFLSMAFSAFAAFAQNPVMTGNPFVLEVNGGAVSWSSKNKIAYNQIGFSRTGYFDLLTVNPDTTGQTCLTCATAPGAGSLPGLNYGGPVYTADGNFIVFQMQMGPSLGNYILDFPGFPGEGGDNDLWATDTIGNFYRLTNQANYSNYVGVGGTYASGGGSCTNGTQVVTFTGGGATTNATGTIVVSGGSPTGAITMSTNGAGYTAAPTAATVATCGSSIVVSGAKITGMGGVIYPTFTFDGTMLAWGQRLVPPTPSLPNNQGAVWELCTASFSEPAGIPTLGTPSCVSPGSNASVYYEPRGWSTDNSTVFMMSNATNVINGWGTFIRNIYSYNLSTGVFLNLTNSSTNWNEYPVTLPTSPFGSNKIIYMSFNLNNSNGGHCNSEEWVMNYDGTDNYQLTFFNTPGSSTYQPPSGNVNGVPICADTHSWNPTGTQLVMYVNQYAANGQSMSQGSDWIINISDLSTVYQTGTWLGSGAIVQ